MDFKIQITDPADPQGSAASHSAWLDAFEFQDREFYERMGYDCFGDLSDYRSK
jgi:hypothetical protein